MRTGRVAKTRRLTGKTTKIAEVNQLKTHNCTDVIFRDYELIIREGDRAWSFVRFLFYPTSCGSNGKKLRRSRGTIESRMDALTVITRRRYFVLHGTRDGVHRKVCVGLGVGPQLQPQVLTNALGVVAGVVFLLGFY